MTYLTKAVACVSALALTVPATAQQSTMEEKLDAPVADAENMADKTWAEVTNPQIRFIQRDSEGNVIFDSAGPELGTGVDDPELADKIERADGETPFATDQAREDWMAENGMRELGANDIVVIRNVPSERRAELAATPQPTRTDGTNAGNAEQTADVNEERFTRGTETPSTGSAMAGDMSEATSSTDADEATASADADDYTQTEMFTTPSGMAIDMETFAREMFEQGYRSGYVSGLTEMRARAVQQIRDERDRMREAYQQRARMDRQSRDQAPGGSAAEQPQVQQRGDGSTVILLPPGMTPQEFQRLMSES